MATQQDITDIRKEEKVGHDDHTNDIAKATQFGNLHDFPCLLRQNSKSHCSKCSDNNDKSTRETCHLIRITNTKEEWNTLTI